MDKQLNLPFPKYPSIWCSSMQPIPYDRVVKTIRISSCEIFLIFDDGSKLRQIYDNNGSRRAKRLSGSDLHTLQEQLPLPFPIT